MNKDLAQRRVSVAQWKSIGARNPKVGGSILHGDSECFLCSTLETRQKNIVLHFFTELKTYHLSYSIHIIVVHVVNPFTPKNNFCLLMHVS